MNILVLAIAGKKLRVPLLWTMIDGRSPSDTAEGIALIGREAIAMLVADLEFIGAMV